ncbi:MAG: hypothetical protein KAX37_11395 [Opitutaceae bacterium]|nr:hypothetical protein [Opitutaceae bacterium]
MNRSKSLQLPFLIASLMLAVVAGAAERSRPSEYEILRSFPPGRLAALSSGDKPDANGFTGGNRANGFWIEVGPQRGSCRGVIAAVVAGDLAAADACWRGIDVAFAHQRADGGFDAIVKPNGTSSREGPAAVETAYFFLQELGRAILVIRESPYESHFHERLVALRPKLRLAADFLLAGYSTIIPKVGHTVNRVIIAAKAFGLCGLALDDSRMVGKSHQLIAHALTLRDKEGVFIERGGRDSSYNVVSILFGQVLAIHLPLPEFEAALPAAVAWQVTRILPSGEVDARGNTRTGVGLEPDPFSGKSKGVNYTEVAMALTLYGTLHHDKNVLAAAERVSAYRQKTEK